MKLIVISILSLIVCTQANFQTSAKDFYDGKTMYEAFCDVKKDCPTGTDRCVAEVYTEQDRKILKRSLVCFSEDHKILYEDKDSGANTSEKEFRYCVVFYPDGTTSNGLCMKYVNIKAYKEYNDKIFQMHNDNFILRRSHPEKGNDLDKKLANDLSKLYYDLIENDKKAERELKN